MAGGEGTRLRPLTSNQPKPMVPIVGKPCMEHILELLRGTGSTRSSSRSPSCRRRSAATSATASRSACEIDYSVEESAARHGRLGAPRERAARRDLPRHLRRRALRRRPQRAGRVPPREGGGGDDRAQVGRQPARVRHRRHRRGRARRALPREALVGPGLLRHDQHRHLRARARGAAARPRRPPVRLLEGALPALLEMGRPIYGHVLDGYWQDVGTLEQFRQANFDALDGAVRLDVPGLRLRGNVWVGEDVDIDRARARSRAPPSSASTAASPTARRSAPTPCSRASVTVARARACRARSSTPHALGRSASSRARSSAALRHPRPRAHPRGRGDRRRGHDRRGGEHLPGRPHLPVQGDRDRLADPREPRLGDAGVEARSSGADGASASSTSTSRRRPRSGSPRRSARRSGAAPASSRAGRRRRRLPDDPARDDRRPDLDRRPRRRPADLCPQPSPVTS